MNGSARTTRPRWMASVGLAVVLAITACSHHRRAALPRRPPPPSTTRATTSTSTTKPAPKGAPLTGLALTDPSVAHRPAVIVKIDNAPEARPQSGLDQADLIVEEKVEGGIARLLAVFQSSDPGRVGPVRSVRSTDPAVVRPVGGLFAYSGGIRPFIDMLHADGGVVDVGFDADPGAYTRDLRRLAPHNLYTTIPDLRKATPGGMDSPPSQFDFLPVGAPFTGAGAATATHLHVPVSPQTVGDWQWDLGGSGWLRTTNGSLHTVEGGKALEMTTVIVQFVPYQPTPYIDPAGNPVDQAVVVGSGDAWVLAAGKVVGGRWSKPAITDVTTYTDATGAPIRIPPGRTWITLAPLGTPTTYS